VGRGLNHRGLQRIRVRRKALKAGAWRWSPLGKTGGQAVGQNVQRAAGERRARTATPEGKTLKSEARTWLWGETNPQRQRRRKPSRT
jgi:hypothetical protein